MLEWIGGHETIVWWLVSASVVTFVGTLIAIPIIVVRLPDDYFGHRQRHQTLWADHHPFVRTLLLIAQNTLGILFVLAGIVMLVLPGQGVLTVVIGLMLVTFPGKYELERWVVSRGPVLRTINRLRRRAGRAPLALDVDA